MGHLWPEDHRAVQEDCIVLSNSKVMHHDAAWDGDGHAALNLTSGIGNFVCDMRRPLHIVSKEEQFACRQAAILTLCSQA